MDDVLKRLTELEGKSIKQDAKLAEHDEKIKKHND